MDAERRSAPRTADVWIVSLRAIISTQQESDQLVLAIQKRLSHPGTLLDFDG